MPPKKPSPQITETEPTSVPNVYAPNVFSYQSKTCTRCAVPRRAGDSPFGRYAVNTLVP